MGLFGFHKKQEEPVKNPLDCSNRPTEWFSSEEGKACWLEAKSHVKEMVDYVTGKYPTWLEGLTRYIGGEYISLPLFPLKYAYEYIGSFDRIEESIYHEFFLYLAFFASADWCDGEALPNNPLAVTYPDFLDWDRNPLLKFFEMYYGRVKNFHKESSFHLGQILIAPSAAVCVIRYICMCSTEKGVDVTDEPWLQDQSIWMKKNIYTNDVTEAPIEEMKKKILAVAKYPEYVRF